MLYLPRIRARSESKGGKFHVTQTAGRKAFAEQASPEFTRVGRDITLTGGRDGKDHNGRLQ
jgi:hypothetical protein